jgi:putative nucleotidyltransferase with HDIG domain
MTQLAAIFEAPEDAQVIASQLTGVFETSVVPFSEIATAEPPGQFSVIGVDLKDSAHIRTLKSWLKTRPASARVIFLTEEGSRLEAAQAHALGATDIVNRVSDIRPTLIKPWSDLKALAAGRSAFRNEASAAIDATLDALQDVFATAVIGRRLETATIDSAGDLIVEQIGSTGLVPWIETVRKHHSQTYQHSLLVTGLAVAFGKHLGLANRDQKRLSYGAILHDIGKAKVPIAILEKPGALDEHEMAIMKRHPLFGGEALSGIADLPPEMIDVVVHHHEYLDGSGYPHGLSGAEISDLVRILTISDIFGALIERRAYKPPLSGDVAYQILIDMGRKLDKDLVREFRGVSQLAGTPAQASTIS